MMADDEKELVSASDGGKEEEQPDLRMEKLEQKVDKMADVMLAFITAQADQAAPRPAGAADEDEEEDEDAEEEAEQLGMADFLSKLTRTRARVKQGGNTETGGGASSSQQASSST